MHNSCPSSSRLTISSTGVFNRKRNNICCLVKISRPVLKGWNKFSKEKYTKCTHRSRPIVRIGWTKKNTHTKCTHRIRVHFQLIQKLVQKLFWSSYILQTPYLLLRHSHEFFRLFLEIYGDAGEDWKVWKIWKSSKHIKNMSC